MRVYVLDIKSNNSEKLLKWLYEDKRVEVIRTFEDHRDFIEMVKVSSPDLCVVRLGRDEIPGLKAADMVKQISPGTRTVFVSSSRDYAVDAYEVGAYGYLLSPVKRDKLEKYLMMKKEM